MTAEQTGIELRIGLPARARAQLAHRARRAAAAVATWRLPPILPALTGAGLISAGVAMIYLPAGLITAGVVTWALTIDARH